MSIYCFKNTESEEARDALRKIGKNLVAKKEYSLKRLSQAMTKDRALRIKILRRNCTYGALADKVAEEWGEDAFWRYYSGDQVVGSALCEVAMNMLGEDLEQFESYTRWFITGDHPALKRPDKWIYDEEEKDSYVKELQDLGYENIKVKEEVI